MSAESLKRLNDFLQLFETIYDLMVNMMTYYVDIDELENKNELLKQFISNSEDQELYEDNRRRIIEIGKMMEELLIAYRDAEQDDLSDEE